METLMEHIATDLGVDPDAFRVNNFLQEGDTLHFSNSTYEGPNPLPDMIDSSVLYIASLFGRDFA